MKYTIPLLILILSTNLVSAQVGGAKEIKGKVVSEAPELENIYIIDLKTEVTTTTEKDGYFRLQVAIGDTLMFAAVQIKGRKIVVTEKDFDADLVFFHLEPIINRLDEVIVKQYKNINAVSLGIIAANTKHYTPAERKLKAASSADIKGNKDGTMGASASLDPLFNWMSGRTALLKKELEIEKKETLLEKLENQFGWDYFTDKLKIPKEYVRGFWYYAIEERRLVNALNTKNKTMAYFVLAELSTNYLELQKGENK